MSYVANSVAIAVYLTNTEKVKLHCSHQNHVNSRCIIAVNIKSKIIRLKKKLEENFVCLQLRER